MSPVTQPTVEPAHQLNAKPHEVIQYFMWRQNLSKFDLKTISDSDAPKIQARKQFKNHINNQICKKSERFEKEKLNSVERGQSRPKQGGQPANALCGRLQSKLCTDGLSPCRRPAKSAPRRRREEPPARHNSPRGESCPPRCPKSDPAVRSSAAVQASSKKRRAASSSRPQAAV